MQERVKEQALCFIASKEKMSADINLKIEGYKAKVASLEKDAVNADRMKSIKLTLAIKAGEKGLNEFCRSHALTWEWREASNCFSLFPIMLSPSSPSIFPHTTVFLHPML